MSNFKMGKKAMGQFKDIRYKRVMKRLRHLWKDYYENKYPCGWTAYAHNHSYYYLVERYIDQIDIDDDEQLFDILDGKWVPEPTQVEGEK